MNLLEIELIDPRAKKLLEELENLNLIKIKVLEEPKVLFQDVLNRLRNKEAEPLSLEEITEEVEIVRAESVEKHGEN